MQTFYRFIIPLTFLLLFDTAFAGFESITWDKSKKKFYVSNTNGSVSEMDENANTAFLASGFGIAKGVKLPFENLLTVAAGNQIIVYSLAVNMVVLRIPVSGSSDLTDIAYSGGKYMYVTDYKKGAVFEVEVVEPFSTRKLSTGFESPKGIQFTGAGLVVVEHTLNSSLKVITPSTGDVIRTINPGLDYAYGIAYDKYGNYYLSAWGASSGGGKVYKLINGIDGDPMEVYSGGSKPANIYYHSPENTIYVPDLDRNYVDMIKLDKLPPVPPVLYNPFDEETDIDTEISFSWRDVSNVGSYSLQISEKSNFSTVYHEDVCENSNYYYDNFDYNTTYYWRVKSSNDNGESPWSTVFSFTTGERNIDMPALRSPDDMAEDIELKPVLEWSEINEEAEYQVQLSTSDFFDENIIVDEVLSATSFELMEELEDNTIYYWRVRAVVGELQSEWSFTRSFTTLEILVPGKPVITYPENNSDDVAVNLTLVWGESENVFEYDILLMDNNREEIHTVTVPVNQLSYEMPFKLENTATYYLVITAFNEDRTISTASDEIKFTTEALSSVLSGLEKVDIVVSPNPASDRIRIELPEDILLSGQNLFVTIYNPAGEKKISLRNVDQDRVYISISNFVSGVYHLVISDGKESLVRNVIINR